ncbi:MAG: hypothetical protein DWQ05_01900 [Calditrichaeota bacterium]|nr:MAG: hypothetical protein DWQ05_01900 [Calditrichota bacterium]
MQHQFNEVIAITKRILTELLRMRRSLVFWVVFPTLLLFGLIYAGGINDSKSFDATVPGILIGAALLLPQIFTLKEFIGKLDGVPVSSVSLREISLEHVYIEVTSDQ